MTVLKDVRIKLSMGALLTGLVIGASAQDEPEPTASGFWVCKGSSMCQDSEGNQVRLKTAEMRNLQQHHSLRFFGCSERTFGTEILSEEINCFQRLAGLPEGPATEQNLAYLHDFALLTGLVFSVSAQGEAEPTASESSVSAQDEPEPTASDDWVCRGISMCHDSEGNRVRLKPADMRNLRQHQALRALGCSGRALDTELLSEEINCFQRLLGLPEGPATERDLALLHEVGISGDRQQVQRYLARRGYTIGGGDPDAAAAKAAAAAEAAIDPKVIVAGHPDAASFVHPKKQKTWMGSEISLQQWLSNHSGGGMAVNLRWPEPSSFAGREFSVLDRGEPAFVVSFGPEGGRVEGADGRISEANYVSRTGFTCIPDPAGFSEECIGLAVQSPGSSDRPWELRAALHVLDDNGFTRPLVFGSLEEGRAAFDMALGEMNASADAAAAKLSAGEELETLPLHGIDVGLAHYLSDVYEQPTKMDAEFDTLARLPFITYHSTYSELCRHDFDGRAIVWRDVQTRLADYSNVPFNRYRIYENYIAQEKHIQEKYYPEFVKAVGVFRTDLLGDVVRSKTPVFEHFADFVTFVGRSMADWTVVYRTLIPRLGCHGKTIDRLETNLAKSHALHEI